MGVDIRSNYYKENEIVESSFSHLPLPTQPQRPAWELPRPAREPPRPPAPPAPPPPPTAPQKNQSMMSMTMTPNQLPQQRLFAHSCWLHPTCLTNVSINPYPL